MRVKRLPRVMIVDDDKDILDLLKYNFEKEGLVVVTVNDSEDAIRVAHDFLPELIILDIMMPKTSGIELCRTFRSIRLFEDVYIFFLTAKSDLCEAALETGGDDFIEKTIGLRSLTSRVSSVLKKHLVIRKGVSELTVGRLKLIRASKSVRINSHEIVLSQPEFELLFFFAQNPCKSISVDSLTRNIWGSEIFMLDSSVEGYIQSLSKKLGLDFIKPTIHNRYRFYIADS